MLTQNSEKGLGGLDRHGEERAGVLALVRQADVTDSDGELLPRGSHQLNSVVSESCIKREGTNNQRAQSSLIGIIHIDFSDSSKLAEVLHVIQMTFNRIQMNTLCFESFQIVVKCSKHILQPVV